MKSLPGPSWLFYVLLAVVIRLSGYVTQSVETGSWSVSYLFPATIGFALPYSLGLIHYLDDVAASALARFRPSMAADDAEYEHIRYQLTTMPARPALLSSMAGVAVAVSIVLIIGPGFFHTFGAFITPYLTALQTVVYLALSAVLGALFYHTIRQLRLVSHIYTTCTQTNLFQLHPLYAFSSLTARTALGFVVIAYAWLSTAPGLLERPETAAILAAFVVLAVVTFVWPLLGIHRLLVEEKQRLKAEAGQRVESTIRELHRQVDSGDLEGRDALKNTIDALVAEQNVLSEISTWPWEADTVRWLATALLLPAVLWIVTRVLERLGF